ITMQRPRLKKMLAMTSFAISRDETRYVLNGALFVIKPTYIRIIATDGRRVAMVEEKTQSPKTHEKKVIIPAKTITELLKLLGDEGEVKICFGNNQVLFDMGSTKVVSRLIEGEFPNYEQVIPKEAKDKVLMGSERKSMIISQDEKKITAFHEAGHTLVARLIPGTDPIHKVTIIPRGMSLGLTQQLPIDERHTYPRNYLTNNIAILLGGRVAEELVFHEMTTGAGNDLEKATDMARRMVCDWGMSENLGPLTFGKKEELIFLGREIAQHRDYSEDTAVRIDKEVTRIVTENYERVKKLINDNSDKLNRLAEALLERESLDTEDIEKIMNGELLAPLNKTADV
ncbi:MAG: hypothetical protein NTZ51_09575, partial [Proteobacteria bacterium]|nr:hypothetical protein [Pseudomonadota bacterium]